MKNAPSPKPKSKKKQVPKVNNPLEDLLGIFKENNPQISIGSKDGAICINRPWGKDDALLKISIENGKLLSLLNNIKFDTRFDAVIHLKENTIEFLYAYLDSDSELETLNRKFDFSYQGQTFNCSFEEPSDLFFQIANVFERIPSAYHYSVPQMGIFKYAQNAKKLDKAQKAAFEKKVPRNFFVRCSMSIEKIDIVGLARHLNFLMRYYDRDAPMIVIKQANSDSSSPSANPIRCIEGGFPKHINSHNYDEVILKLLEVAETSNPRFSYIYYYQVIEYAAHHYVDKEARKLIRGLLRDPTIINCSEEKFSSFFSALTSLNHGDETKIEKTIEECCCPEILWKEVENDKGFFTTAQTFEGGVIIPALISSADFNELSWKGSWHPKLIKSLTKIRNTIVHSREKREPVSILPTRKNHELLSHYIPLIRRVAEMIAMRL